MQSAVVVITPT